MNRKCISCGKRFKLLGENEGIKILQCKACGLGATEQRGKQRQYAAYHRDQVYIKEKEQFRNIFEKRVKIISEFKKTGKVLEIGSSTGIFLSLLKQQDWEVQGIEPSKPAASAAQKRKIPTIVATFENADISHNSFDLIIFNHVLEHMENPLEVLQKANAVLKKDGLIFIDAPNFASLTARIWGAHWAYILPKEHRWHFTPQALSLLLEKVGFKMLYCETHSGVWNYGNPAKEIWQSLIKLRKRFFTNIVTFLPSFIVTKMGMGSGVTVIAQKV